VTTTAVEPIVGPIRGFRWWRVTGSSLASPWRGDLRWAPDDNKASCLGRRWLHRWKQSDVPHERGVPESGCSCGFYGLLDPPDRRWDGPSSWPLSVSLSGGPISLVFGVIAGSGRVLLAQHGWRAERARVDALFVPRSRTPSNQLLEVVEAYGTPLYRDLDELYEERGPDPLTVDLAGLPA
jgi:hypothetical protein